ncbi:MAG: NAD-dependent epimerase/dehydratase family protein [Deltaproteobacteria bacterium]|nr:MAG: NAD-dependent epimerase/dehydratase family protein [Deltaproteobacteria bacterium]
MTVFLTGATGYLGGYVCAEILSRSDAELVLLVRADDERAAIERLWKGWQLHMDAERFAEVMGRVHLVHGDLTAPNLGLDDETWGRLARGISSVLHIAASLNRKSAKACFNVNLRGTLSVIRLARDAADHHGLSRFSDVSTAAVAGVRKDEVVTEDETIDWDRSDYDPYARTKKFCEHMVHELLPDVPKTVFRPTTVLGDSRFPETTQFDMVYAFAVLAYAPVVPLDPDWRMDIVPADYVGEAIARLHLGEPAHDAYSLSSGTASPTFREIVDALRAQGHPMRPVFVPRLSGPTDRLVDRLMSTPRKLGISRPASLLKVFLPYLTYNTVFDNRRVVEALGKAPRPFTEYCYSLLRFAVSSGFTYPHRPLPADLAIARPAEPFGAARPVAVPASTTAAPEPA